MGGVIGGALHRHFTRDVEAIAERWRADPIQALRVTQSGRYLPTAERPCPVIIEGVGNGFIKPHPDAPDEIGACREKIASDLAFDLELPVPPVFVKLPCDRWQHHCSVSLLCTEEQRAWGAGTDELRELAGPSLAALRVFWTWIADTDHAGHHGNLRYLREDGVVKLFAIDHTRSLGHGVRGDLLEIPASIGYGAASTTGANEAAARLVERIQSFPRGALDIIVGRLGGILTLADQRQIVDLLQVRAEALPGLLSRG